MGSKNEKKVDLTDFLREESSMGPYCRGKTSAGNQIFSPRAGSTAWMEKKETT
jgi:hypothetical protein